MYACIIIERKRVGGGCWSLDISYGGMVLRVWLFILLSIA